MPRHLRVTLNLNISSLAILLLAIPLLDSHLLDIRLLKDILPKDIPNLATHLSTLLSNSTPSNSTHPSRLLILDSIHLQDILSSLPVASKLPQVTPDLVVLPLNTQVVTLLSQEFLSLATPVTLPSSSLASPDSILLKVTLLVVRTINDELLYNYLIH